MRLCPPMHGLTDLNVWSIHLGCVNMYVSDWCTGKKNDRDPSHALFLMHFLNSIFYVPTCIVHTEMSLLSQNSWFILKVHFVFKQNMTFEFVKLQMTYF